MCLGTLVSTSKIWSPCTLLSQPRSRIAKTTFLRTTVIESSCKNIHDVLCVCIYIEKEIYRYRSETVTNENMKLTPQRASGPSHWLHVSNWHSIGYGRSRVEKHKYPRICVVFFGISKPPSKGPYQENHSSTSIAMKRYFVGTTFNG